MRNQPLLKKGKKQNSIFSRLIIFYLVLLAFGLNISLFPLQIEKIHVLEKSRELGERFGEGEDDYFWHIDDICCDDEGNLYVADSGWNKIFRFSRKGRYLGSFGREGQAPGEFLAAPRRQSLNVSFGKDNNIYVVDTGNWRLSVFTKEGTFLKHFSWPPLLYDSALVNSEGEILMISKDSRYVLECYDRNFKLKRKFMNPKWHFDFPIIKPPSQMFRRYISNRNLKKALTKNDTLIVLSNLALAVFQFDRKLRFLNKFQVYNRLFRNDFKKRLEQAMSQGGFILPFLMALDENDNICLCYFNDSLKKREIYRYNQAGELLDILRLPEDVGSIFCIDNGGRFYFDFNNKLIKIFNYRTFDRK